MKDYCYFDTLSNGLNSSTVSQFSQLHHCWSILLIFLTNWMNLAFRNWSHVLMHSWPVTDIVSEWPDLPSMLLFMFWTLSILFIELLNVTVFVQALIYYCIWHLLRFLSTIIGEQIRLRVWINFNVIRSLYFISLNIFTSF